MRLYSDNGKFYVTPDTNNQQAMFEKLSHDRAHVQVTSAGSLPATGSLPCYHLENIGLTTYTEDQIIPLAKLAAELGVLIHVEGMPFGAPGHQLPTDDKD